MELTMQVAPQERTVRLKEVHALAGGDVCSLVLSGVREALPDLRMALYTGADMETLVASCVSFSPVPGHASERMGTFDMSTVEMGAWFSAELERLSDAETEAVAAGRKVPPRDPFAPVPAWGWLLVFDSARTWVSCRVPVLLRPSDPGADGVTPIGPVLAGKADKVPSATPGNLASLDASGNLADSGATPESIKAAAVAEVVANAPGTMDTLKEIADILGSSQEAGTVLKRVLDLEGGKVDKVPGKGLSANDYTNADKAKLAGIAAGATAVTIDSALSQTSENPVQNKVVREALYTGFTEWEFSGSDYVSSVSYTMVFTVDQWLLYSNYGTEYETCLGAATGAEDDTIVNFIGSGVDITATRHLITPTKTSQLANDGPPSGPNVGHPFATTNQIPAPVDISGKLDGAAAYEAWMSGIPYPSGAVVSHNGRLWECLESNNPDEPSDSSSYWDDVRISSLKQDALSSSQLAAVNSGATAAKVAAWDGYAAQIAQKANAADLPYAMVTPGKWEFSGVPSGYEVTAFQWHDVEGDDTGWEYEVSAIGGGSVNGIVAGTEMDLLVDISISLLGVSLIATRPSLPGHLCDRAVNNVSLSADATLTLPPAVDGKARDLVVRTAITGTHTVSISSTDASGQGVTMLDTPSFFDGAIFGITEVAPGVFSVTDPNPPLSYALVAKTPVNSAVTLSDRAVNLVSPTVTATTEWTWADGETGTPIFSNGQWTVQNASFDTYDGPVAGSATDTEITFAKTDTKSFYYSTTDYDYDTGEQVFVFNVGGAGGEEVRAKGKWSDNYYENIVESVEYNGVEYALEYPVTESSTGNTYSGTGTVVEHVVSLVTTYGPTITFTMPQAVPGRVRDLIARIDLSQAAGAPPVAFSGGSFEAAGGEMPELVKGVNLLSFTETASGVFAVAYKEVKPIVQGGS